MAHGVDAGAGHRHVVGEGHHGDPGPLGDRRRRADRGGEQGPQDQSRALAQHLFCRNPGAFGRALGVPHHQLESIVGDVEQGQLGGVQQRLAQTLMLSRQGHEQRHLVALRTAIDGAGLQRAGQFGLGLHRRRLVD